MENTVKVTKMDVLNALEQVMENYDGEITGDVTVEDIMHYIDVTKASLEKKKEAAAARAAEKKAEGDALRARVEEALTDEFQTGCAILKAVATEGEELSQAMITARLTQLVNAGVAVKEQTKVGDRKVMSYKLA